MPVGVDAVEVVRARSAATARRPRHRASSTAMLVARTRFGDRLQGRGVQGFLALEVVVEQRLVDAGGLGNLLGARAGQAVLAEFADGGVENAGAGLVGAFGLGAGWSAVDVIIN